MTESKQLPTAHGAPVGDNQNSLTAGPREPVLLASSPCAQACIQVTGEPVCSPLEACGTENGQKR